MKYAKKETYFRDIIIFINRIKNIIRVKDVKFIQNNFQIYLRDETFE